MSLKLGRMTTKYDQTDQVVCVAVVIKAHTDSIESSNFIFLFGSLTCC
jgi:hypothetical protein